MDDIQLDWAFGAIDQNAQQVILQAAQSYVRSKQSTAPTEVAPADGGREGDEQYPAPIDALKLVDSRTTETDTTYDVEVSYGGNLDHIEVVLDNAGNTQVRTTE